MKSGEGDEGDGFDMGRGATRSRRQAQMEADRRCFMRH